MIFYILLLCVPAAMGQLFLGICPRPPPSVQDLNVQKYSGNWFVVAQSIYHPLSAADCAKVTYSNKSGNLSANFSYVDRRTNHKIFKHATIKKQTHPSGDFHLKFDDSPRYYEFRVLKSNYSDVAVEYTCVSGVLHYLASITVLHRRPPMNLGDVNTALHRFNLTSDIAPHFREGMKLVNHRHC